MTRTGYHGSDKHITEIDQPIWVTDSEEAAADYCDTHMHVIEIDDSRYAHPDDIPEIKAQVFDLDDWTSFAAEILAAGYKGLRFDGDLSPNGQVHDSWFICDLSTAEIA